MHGTLSTPPKGSVSSITPPKCNSVTPPRMSSVTSSPKRTLKEVDVSPRSEAVSPPKKIASPPIVVAAKVISPPMKVTSPPAISVRTDSKLSQPVASKFGEPVASKIGEPVALKTVEAPVAPKNVRREPGRDAPFRMEKLSLVAAEAECTSETADLPPPEPETKADVDRNNEESNGVGDKIKIFEKAAEDAATAGRLSRPGSMRRPRTERLPSDELPPPPDPEPPLPPPERHASLASREPRIVRPEFRPLASPAEVTIRSPSLGSKAPERFPSHGTAFRNVSSVSAPSPTPAEPARPRDSPDDADDDPKSCKYRGRAAASRGSSYFTRGSEEIWLVKKKDIEEIEERVLDSFRRAGRGGTVRGKRGYARSESLEASSGMRSGEWAGRAHTLKRQSSVACTCGHDKKTRPRTGAETTPRPRSRSHGDPGDTAVLDKYETLV